MSNSDEINDFATADSSQDSAGEPSSLPSSSSSSSSDFLGSGDLDELAGRVGGYEVKSVLGSGGMGKVYLAEHVRMGRPVALKILPRERTGDDASVERFFAEIRAASRLLHPNIVAAFDAGEFDGIHYFAMEYIDGETLTEVVAKNGPLSLGTAASMIRQAALGLLQAHRAGIIHRDVKPGNLMRSADGTIKLLDLGLAQLNGLPSTVAIESSATVPANRSETPAPEPSVAAPSRPGAAHGRGESSPADRPPRRLVGTLPFMSPEQLESPDQVDSRSDIYSLGATLFFLLTGRPPFTGQLIDIVYGHRHGELPDLMEIRQDVDMNFAHVFRRMMAKSPNQRFASVDEVIDELEPYADASSTPAWLAEFTGQRGDEYDSTSSGESTVIQTSGVLGIDLGMFYAAAAVAHPDGRIDACDAGGEAQLKGTPGGEAQSMLRMALANDGDGICYGQEAIGLRVDHPEQVAHCLAMYLGREFVERQICDSPNPPEVLLAMLLKRIRSNSWHEENPPAGIAISVPAVYDQLHRRSILQAARIAGFKSPRLVDRTLAVAQAAQMHPDSDIDADAMALDADDCPKRSLVVCLSGLGVEVSVVRSAMGRVHQLGVAGHWNNGTLAWQTRLVELAAEQFQRMFKIDPRDQHTNAAQLQIACERAMHSLFLLPVVNISLNVGGKIISVPVRRDKWLERCEELIDEIRRAIAQACRRAEVPPEKLDSVITFGPLLKVPEIRMKILDRLDADIRVDSVARLDVARGVAAIVAGELPGRVKTVMPPTSVTGQSIGIVIEDAKGRRRILPVIPRGTTLPARTNRKLTVGKNHKSMKLSLVESAGPTGEQWQALGRYDFELPQSESDVRSRTRMISFQVDPNGVLAVRAQNAGTAGSVRLNSLPLGNIDDLGEQDWTSWLRAIN